MRAVPIVSDWTDVAPADEIAPGEFKVVDLDALRVAVFNVGGEFYAIEDRCSHDDGELTGGVVEGCEVMCPRHGAKFDLRTGEALTAPAYEPVETFPVRVEGGVVQVRGPADD